MSAFIAPSVLGPTNAVLGSLTVLANGPYTPTAVAGGEDFSGAVRVAGGLPVFNVTHPTYGAIADAKRASDGVMNGTTAVLTSATGLFTASDVGKQIAVNGAGAAGAQLVTTIASFQSATQVTLTAVSQTAVAAALIGWGTDNTAAFNLATSAANTAGGGIVFAPAGRYYFGTNGASNFGIHLFNNTTLMGVGRATELVLHPVIAYLPGFIVTIGNNVANVVSDVTIRDLYFDGNERNMQYSVGGQNAPIYGEGAGNFLAPVHVGINMSLVAVSDVRNGSQTQNLRIFDCTFNDIARESIWMGTDRNVTGQIDHTDTLIANCIFTGCAYLTTMESSKRCSIVGNTVNGVKMTDPANGGWAISLNFRDLTDIEISDNMFDGGGANSDGVRASDSRQGGNVVITDLVVANNTFRNFGSGITTRTSAAIATLVRANIVNNTVVSNHTLYGIYALDNCNVVGNYVALNDNVGINIAGSNGTCKGNLIRSNNRLNNANRWSAGLLFGDGTVSVTDTLASWVVVGNRIWDDNGSQFQNAWGTGIPTVFPTNLTIAYNDVRGNLGTNAGFMTIRVQQQTGTSVRNNPGWNPMGVGGNPVTTPGFPATNVVVTNTTGADVTAYITNGVNALTVQVDAIAALMVIPASQTGTVRIPAGSTFKPTYGGGVPTWVWYGE